MSEKSEINVKVDWEIDELLVYRGDDIHITDEITIHQPTLNEICDYGEKTYFSMVYSLTSTGADLKWQLDELGVDYTQISDYQLFYSILVKSWKKEQTSILFGELDLQCFQLFTRNAETDESVKEDSDEVILYDQEHDIVIDERIYRCITDSLRLIHGTKRNDQLPANESTKRILIEDAREEYHKSMKNPCRSTLKNLISSMVNWEGFKYDHTSVWSMKIHPFMDSVRRTNKIKNANLLLQSGYSGFGINLQTIKKEELDWMSELD